LVETPEQYFFLSPLPNHSQLRDGRHFTTIMADIEKSPEQNVAATQASTDNVRPEGMSGWIYKRWKIGPWTTSYYASPLTQTLIMSFALFLLPGMSNALYVYPPRKSTSCD
jgi:hypothetical protein